MEITHTLNKAQATALFEKEAIYFFHHDAVPEYRITELFGESMGAWVESCIGANGYIEDGRDWTAFDEERTVPFRCNSFAVFFLPGFLKIVTKHNSRIHASAHQSCAAGAYVDSLWEARYARIDAIDAANAAKRKQGKEARKQAAERRKAAQQAAAIGTDEGGGNA